jgi:hypothetical protein
MANKRSQRFNIQTTLDREWAAHKIATHKYSTEGIGALMQLPPGGMTENLSKKQFQGQDPVKYLDEDHE